MRVVHFSSEAEIKKRFEEIDVAWEAIPMMLEKFEFYIIEIPSVRNVEANILKQEILVLGGEAAINQHSISCSVPETPVLISGTKKMFRTLVERLEHQVGTLPELAKGIKTLLFS